MSTLNQIGAVTVFNLKSLPQRAGTSSVIVVCIAGVIAVLISALAMASGLNATLSATGRPDRAIVLSSGATHEGGSALSQDAVRIIMDAPGIRRVAAASGPSGAGVSIGSAAPTNGAALASGEAFLTVRLPKRSGVQSGIALRGIAPAGFAIRPEIRLIEGRALIPGLKELMVGRGAQAEFSGLGVGQQVLLRDGAWTVVGVFASGDSHESELLADADTLLAGFQGSQLGSVTVLLESPAAFETFRDALTTNPALSVDVLRERDYYQRQAQELSRVLYIVANVVGGVMALGALFAALNAMYAAVSARAVEIGTLRALGFGSFGVVAATLAEALLLACGGAVLGAAIAWSLFNGSTVSAAGRASQIAFDLRIGPDLIATGIGWALLVGLIGGLLPAIRAARLPVATVLRAI